MRKKLSNNPKPVVFIAIPWFHPAYRAGGPVQSIANMVNELKDDISFRIFCGNTDLNNTPLDNIQINTWIPYNENTLVWYAGPHNRKTIMLQQIGLINPDRLYTVGIFSWHFNIVPILFSKVMQKIVSVRGMLHPGALSQKKIKKKIFLMFWKLSQIKNKILFHATDETEKNFIHEIFGSGVKVAVAGNFPRKFITSPHIYKSKNSLTLISIALISPMKNHLLVLQALAMCKVPIRYLICGPVKDMEYWQKCLELIRQLPLNVNVEYVGELSPSHVEAILQKAHLFILPSKSENFGHAFYEALSAGKPVITSHNTPWQDLKRNNAGLNVGFNAEEVAGAILFFASMENEEYQQWSIESAQYAQRSINMDLIHGQYMAMFSRESSNAVSA